MRFFKHFTDADKGSLGDLMNDKKFGVEAYGRYWLLIELCVEKLEKDAEESFTKDDMSFTFSSRQVRQKLRIRQTNLHLLLDRWSTQGNLTFTFDGNKYNFYIPKILESLDRDSKRARTERAPSAPKIEIKKEIKNIYKGGETNLFNILNKTELQHVVLTKASEIEQVTDLLNNDLVFAGKPPTLVKNNTQAFCAAVLKAYNFEVGDFKSDLNAIINEKFAEERTGPAKADYIAARIKTKALELFNAAG